MSKIKNRAWICGLLVGATIVNSVGHANLPRNGIVIASKKMIKVRNNNPHPVKHYAAAGGTIGVFSGVVFGGLIAGPVGVVVMPFIYGAFGAGLGTGTGVLSSVFNPPQAVKYQYKVKSLSDSKIYTIQQGAQPIRINTKVRIIERNNKLLIRS